MSDIRPAAVMILAAGAGTRMKSATPKVLHRIAGRSLVHHSLTAAAALKPGRTVVVVRHDRDLVAAHVQEVAPEVLLADQDDIPGTGRAVACGLSALDATAIAAAVAAGQVGDEAVLAAQVEGAIVVTSGDVPLVDGTLLQALLNAHHSEANAVTLLTAEVPDATGYGRVVRDASTGELLAIVEHKDATDQQRQITEINAGIYVFDATRLRSALAHVKQDNAQGEMYLTDVIELARSEGGRIGALVAPNAAAVEGVNDRVQLAKAARSMNRAIVENWMREGVTVVDPRTTWIDAGVTLEQDVTLYPGTQLYGTTVVQADAVVGPDTTLTDVDVGPRASVVRSQATDSSIGADAVVGPFSYLRPGTTVGAEGKVGAYVETKAATLGKGTKVPHLSYVGDATIGEGSNIGAGTIFVNYDGVSKHHTTVGDHVRIGSDNALIAPVTIGDGAYTGAGSTILRDIPPGSLGVSTANQQNIDGWVERRRPGTASAAAAARAMEAQHETGDLSPGAREERDAAVHNEGEA